jgi:hypothetical protein
MNVDRPATSVSGIMNKIRITYKLVYKTCAGYSKLEGTLQFLFT